MPVDRALRLLAAVVTDAEDLFAGLATNARDLEKAQKVSKVFKVYETRLQALHLALDGTGLTNTESDLVGEITRRAKNARRLLEKATITDTAVALDRAYQNGAEIEEHLDNLRQKRNVTVLAYGIRDISLGGEAKQAHVHECGRRTDKHVHFEPQLAGKSYRTDSTVLQISEPPPELYKRGVVKVEAALSATSVTPQEQTAEQLAEDLILPGSSEEDPETFSPSSVQPQRLYESAVEVMDVEGMVNLGVLLHNGADGVPKNPARSLDLYERAIDHGHVKALFNLAHLLATGADGVLRHPARSVQLYRQAIDRGDVDALVGLGLLLETGKDDVPADPVKSVQLYERAIARGSANALFNLGNLLWKGAAGVSKKPARSVELYERAIESGREDAMVSLGILLSKGEDGVPQNAVRSVELLEKAIVAGNLYAMNHLAILFETGADGVSSDHPRSVELYKRVIEDGRNKSLVDYAKARLELLE